MFERISRSYRLFKECINVLMQDKEMLLFPIFSAIFTLLVVLSFIIPVGYFSILNLKDSIQTKLFVYYGLFIFYLLTYFIIYFFNTAIIICAAERLKGGNPTFVGGIKAAFKKVDKILYWALISAVIGILIRLFERATEKLRFGPLANTFTSLFGIGWTLATYFIIPVMVFEDEQPFRAIKKSAQIFRQTWGESVIGNFGLSLFTSVLFLLGIIAGVLTMFLIYNTSTSYNFWPYFFVGAVISSYFILLTIVVNVLGNIYTTALYFYAIQGQNLSGFSQDVIKDAWLTKRQIGNI